MSDDDGGNRTMMPRTRVGRLRIGTRGSALARAQSAEVAGALRRARPGLEVEIVAVMTEGDRSIDRPLPEIGGKGLFTAELEDGLRRGEVDLAVHSLKDLPTALADGLCLAAVPARADPRDVLIPTGRAEKGGDLDALPRGAVVGTSSIRRAAQLRTWRPDCRVRSIRGNVETRIRKAREQEYDALILAAAGLSRLGLSADEAGAAFLEPPAWLPAVGQGALAVQARAHDGATRALLEPIENSGARAEAEAERALLAALEGGCQVPVGALARRCAKDSLDLQAAVFAPADAEGEEPIRGSIEGNAAEAAALGRELARRLLAAGADRYLSPLPP